MGKELDENKHRNISSEFLAMSFFLAPLYFKPPRATERLQNLVKICMMQQVDVESTNSM